MCECESCRKPGEFGYRPGTLEAAGIAVLSPGPIPEGTVPNQHNLPPAVDRLPPLAEITPKHRSVDGPGPQPLLSLQCSHLSSGPGPSQLMISYGHR